METNAVKFPDNFDQGAKCLDYKTMRKYKTQKEHKDG